MYVRKIDKIDITKLRQWFDDVRKNHLDREFFPTNPEHFNEIIPYWQNRFLNEPQKFNQSGFCITSKIPNEYPQPPYDISIRLKNDVEHDTPICYGYVKELKELFKEGFRWIVSCQRFNGRVEWHRDLSTEMVIWIPIYTSNEYCCSFIDENNNEHHYSLDSDGSVYLVDNRIKHCTYNNTNIERIMLIFYFKIENSEILERYKENVCTKN